MYKALFDLHCDTLFELYKRGLSFDSGETMISGNTARLFSPYRQVFAFWSDPALSPDEQWRRFLDVTERIGSFGLPENAILAVEGGSLLDNKIERLDILAVRGVKILTLVWGGNSCIGGAHDSDFGFTDFGREAAKRCNELGILADYSHAGDRMLEEGLSLPYPMLCSHSNSRAVFPHTRNLTDEFFLALKERKSIVGLSMAAAHIGARRNKVCCFDDLIDHLEHYLLLGGEDCVCLGCDLDGIAKGPSELKNQSSLLLFSELLYKRGIGEAMQKKLFFDNASRFFALQKLF